MKQADKKGYQAGVQARLAEDKKNSKHVICDICNLKIRASGSTGDERIENHKKGFHCKPPGSSKRGYR